jgi:hypothetical protein
VQAAQVVASVAAVALATVVRPSRAAGATSRQAPAVLAIRATVVRVTGIVAVVDRVTVVRALAAVRATVMQHVATTARALRVAAAKS